MHHLIRHFEVGSLESLNDGETARICDCFSKYGCLVIGDGKDRILEPSAALARLGANFGNPIFHKLSDAAGVHPIRSIPGYPNYANTTTADLLLHTDGSFEQNPPRAMLILCEQPAAIGGLSRICFAKGIHEFIASKHPDALAGLYLPDAFTIRRDDRLASKPVFKREGQRIAMAFRYGADVELRIHPRAKDGFEIIEAYLRDAKNFAEFKLDRNQILIMDNTRVLHGRTHFPDGSSRILHGLWLDGNGPLSLGLKYGFTGDE